MNVTRCDICKKDLDQISGLRVERIGDGETVVRMWAQRDSYDVCGSNCLSELARRIFNEGGR